MKGVIIKHQVDNNIETRPGVVTIDLTDAGEVGYRFGHNPESLTKLEKTIYEVLLPKSHEYMLRYGTGAYWDKTLDTRGGLTVLACPMRMQQLNELFTHEYVYKVTSTTKRLHDFVYWLKSREDVDKIVIYCNRVPTALNKAIMTV